MVTYDSAYMQSTGIVTSDEIVFAKKFISGVHMYAKTIGSLHIIKMNISDSAMNYQKCLLVPDIVRVCNIFVKMDIFL